MYATHPPLLQRIAALDPTFTRRSARRSCRSSSPQQPPDGLAEDAALGLVGAAAPRPAPRPAPTRSDATVRVDPSGVSARVRSVDPDDLARGARLSARIPARLRTAASQAQHGGAARARDAARRTARVRERAAADHRRRAGASRRARGRDGLATEVGRPGRRCCGCPSPSWPLPQLTARPVAERTALAAALDDLARADGTITVFEYCLAKVVGDYLLDAESPRARSRAGRAPVRAVEDAAVTLLAVVAAAGNADPAAAGQAFAAAVARLLPGRALPFAPPADPWRALDAGWDPLNTLDPRNKQVLIESVVAAVSADGVLAPEEAELLRATCSILRCPLPPLVA